MIANFERSGFVHNFKQIFSWRYNRSSKPKINKISRLSEQQPINFFAQLTEKNYQVFASCAKELWVLRNTFSHPGNFFKIKMMLYGLKAIVLILG